MISIINNFNQTLRFIVPVLLGARGVLGGAASHAGDANPGMAVAAGL